MFFRLQLLLPPSKEYYIPDVEPFTGNLANCQGFLIQCPLVFNEWHLTCFWNQSKLNYIMWLFRGIGLAEAVDANQSVVSLFFWGFCVKNVFDLPDHCGKAAKHYISFWYKCGWFFCGVKDVGSQLKLEWWVFLIDSHFLSLQACGRWRSQIVPVLNSPHNLHYQPSWDWEFIHSLWPKILHLLWCRAHAFRTSPSFSHQAAPQDRGGWVPELWSTWSFSCFLYY